MLLQTDKQIVPDVLPLKMCKYNLGCVTNGNVNICAKLLRLFDTGWTHSYKSIVIVWHREH
jgi:hypothetical protein